MEFLWEVDEDDVPVGKIERGEAHAKHVLHRTGIVFLLDEDSVYITFRAPTKKIYPACCDASAAFHVTYGESYDEAAKREVLEELGIEPELKFIGKFRHSDGPENQWVAVFVAEYAGQDIVLDKEEAVDGGFYSVNGVKDILATKKVTPWLREGWKLLSQKKGGKINAVRR